MSRLTVHSWMAALQTERLEQKTQAITRRVEQCNGSWEDAYFVTLARSYGFGINSDAFEQWARQVPLAAVGKHRDDLFQIEAIFMGQAGLLDWRPSPSATATGAAAMATSPSAQRVPVSGPQVLAEAHGSHGWRFLRCVRRTSPTYACRSWPSSTTSRRRTEPAGRLRDRRPVARAAWHQGDAYWETHYTFGSESARNGKNLSPFSLNLLMINTAIPMLFAVGRHRQKEALCDRAFDFLEQLKAEQNHIIRMWRECGLDVQSAGDSQALIQLKNEYCDRKDCLRCRFGYEYLKKK